MSQGSERQRQGGLVQCDPTHRDDIVHDLEAGECENYGKTSRRLTMFHCARKTCSRSCSRGLRCKRTTTRKDEGKGTVHCDLCRCHFMVFDKSRSRYVKNRGIQKMARSLMIGKTENHFELGSHSLHKKINMEMPATVDAASVHSAVLYFSGCAAFL